MIPWDPLTTGDREMGSYCPQVPLDTQTFAAWSQGPKASSPLLAGTLGPTQSPEEGDKHRGSIQGRC